MSAGCAAGCAALVSGWTGFRECLSGLRSEWSSLASAAPTEACVRNCGLRVAKAVREESARLSASQSQGEAHDSLHSMWAQGTVAMCAPPCAPSLKSLRSAVIESLGELLSEMEGARS